MHAVPVVRKVFLGALVALAFLAGALFVATPKASAALSDCSGGRVCVWSGAGYGGTFSWWGLNTGCHNHAFNPTLRSVYNNTGGFISIPSIGAVFNPFTAASLGAGQPSITGAICT
jgi:Peptidase inhibitor family I36